MFRMQAIALGWLLPHLAFGFEAQQIDAPTKPIKSGREVGQSVPSFYVRAVTGPLRNTSVCYVCRNGNRPVVMVLMQRLDPKLKDLLKGIDRIVDQNRAVGLRSFGVLIHDDTTEAIPLLQTMAFDEKITLPLTVGGTIVAVSTCQDLHPDAATTVVLYRKQRIVSSFAFRTGELKESRIRDVLKSVRQLAED